MSSHWYDKLDRENRRFGGDLPVDAFLPELDDRTSAPAPAPAVHATPDVAGVDAEAPSGGPGPADLGLGVPFSEREPLRSVDDSLGADDPQEPPTSDPVEDEIQAFMNRNRTDLADDEDIEEFLNNAIDPNID